MNACGFCKFARLGDLEVCKRFAKNEALGYKWKDFDDYFKIPQMINYQCEYLEQIHSWSKFNLLRIIPGSYEFTVPVTASIWEEVFR